MTDGQQDQATGSADAAFTVEDRLSLLEGQVVTLKDQVESLTIKLATAQLPAATSGGAGLDEAWIAKLEDHGIRVTDEDRAALAQAKADGSGTERWGSQETWAESHDAEGAPV